MKGPLDYAAGEGEALGVEAGDITYAALLDRHAAEEPITDEMVRRACLRTESAQRWPFAASPKPILAGIALAGFFRVRR